MQSLSLATMTFAPRPYLRTSFDVSREFAPFEEGGLLQFAKFRFQ